MRKIEQQMIEAIRDLIGKADYDGVYFKSGNTTVEQVHDGIAGTTGYERIIWTRLHGNNIAAIKPARRQIWLGHCGWRTATTKSRLCAILSELTPAPYFLCQIEGEWVKDYGDGRREPWGHGDTLPLLLRG